MGHGYPGILRGCTERDALSRTLHAPYRDQQQPYPQNGRKHGDHKDKGLQKRRGLEKSDIGWDRVCPSFSDAYSAKGVCPDTALWASQQPEQEEVDPAVQESDRLSGIPEET